MRCTNEFECCDIAIVGSGIGGLTAGALLAREGMSVLVFEQHNTVGGYCHNWRRTVRINGVPTRISFDAAVHDISGVEKHGSVHTILEWLGLSTKLDWARVAHEYLFEFGNFPVGNRIEEFVRLLKSRYPAEVQGIDAFFGICKTSYQELFSLARETDGIPRLPHTLKEMRQFRQSCPTVARHLGLRFVDFRNSHLHSAELRRVVSILSVYITDDISQLSFSNMLPLFGYLLNGGSYPRGGSQALANLLAESISRSGCRVLLKAPVTQINVKHGKATGLTLGDGTCITAKTVIANSDPYYTFSQLLAPPEHDKPVRPAIQDYKCSCSAFLVFLILDCNPEIAESTIVSSGEEGVIISKPPFQDFASLGYTAITLTQLVSPADSEKWDRCNPDYAECKIRFGDRLIEVARLRIPSLSEHIVYREDASPATLKRYIRSTGGAAYGATPQTRASHRTEIDGLFLVGASTGLGPGIEAVMIGGASLAKQIWSMQIPLKTRGDNS